MADPAPEGTIEVVRGQIAGEPADQLLDFWSSRGVLEGAAARERVPEVVCVARGEEGEIVGVNSVYPQNIPLIGGRRFWVYRSFLLPHVTSMAAAMINAAFAALEEEFDQSRDGPIGLCLLVADAAEMERHPEAIWPETQLMYAGYTRDDRQARIRYFDDAVIEPGLPNSPTLSETRSMEYRIGDSYRIEPFAETSFVTREDVLAFWERERAIPVEKARRRVDEVVNVAIERDEGLVALATAYLERSVRLRMDMWYFRTYVAEAHRHTHLASQLTFHTRDLLEQRFVSGEDTRAAGIVIELEHEGLRTYFNRAVWLPGDFTFIGDNQLGEPVRVHYFPGALAPAPS